MGGAHARALDNEKVPAAHRHASGRRWQRISPRPSPTYPRPSPTRRAPRVLLRREQPPWANATYPPGFPARMISPHPSKRLARVQFGTNSPKDTRREPYEPKKCGCSTTRKWGYRSEQAPLPRGSRRRGRRSQPRQWTGAPLSPPRTESILSFDGVSYAPINQIAAV